MVTSLPFLPHRHSSRIRPRWIPRVSLQAETRRRTIQESFTTHYTHPFSLSCPSWPSFRQKRNQHPVGSLGILQVFRQRLFCELQFGQCSKLLRLSQTSTPRVLLPSTPGQDEMSLRQHFGHDHVPFRKKSREIVLQVLQATVSFLSVGGSRPQGTEPRLVRSRQVHLSLWRKSSQTHPSRCLDRNSPPKRCAQKHRPTHGSLWRELESSRFINQNKIQPGPNCPQRQNGTRTIPGSILMGWIHP